MSTIYNSFEARLSIYKKDLRERGLLYFINSRLKKNKESLLCNYFKIRRSLKKFRFQDSTYNYFFHQYNFTWNNERAIEVPIIWQKIKENREKEILEVGNVCSHYFSVKHDVLDKYEIGKGVINKDILDFQTQKKYDLIVSISTIEHMGLDEEKKDSFKIIKVIKKLKELLKSNGKIIITFPIGYNSSLDFLVMRRKIKFSKTYFMKRISKENEWKEVQFNDINKIKFNKPFPFANAVLIGIINN